MKKKNLFFLIMIVCVGLLIPKDTFALQVYNNVNIDYRFFVDEDESNAGNLKFELYDKTGTLNFESKYDPSTKHYYFEYNDINYDKRWNYVGVYGWSWVPFGWDSANYVSYDSNILSYYPSQFTEIFNSNYRNENFFETFLKKNSYVGTFSYYDGQGTTIVCYTFIPLILESVDTDSKKIVFANTSIRNFGDRIYTQLFFVNNTTKIKNEPVMIGDSFLENVDFMRKTSLDYSDELWEELNNGPIASSEIYSDNIASTNYKYINQSINGGTRNVPEETLEDYASSLPVLSFKKADSTDEDKDNNTKNNIVNVIINPKTWNNGVVILVISMVVIIGSSIVLIRKRKV